MIVQMSPQAIILVTSYTLGFFLVKNYLTLRIKVFIFFAIFLVFSWIYHTKIFDPTSSGPTHGTLLKNLSTLIFEYTDHLGGFGLPREWRKYPDYGTISSEENFFWNQLLSVTTII